MNKSFYLIALLGWFTIFMYILAPPSYILGLPSNIFIADLFWILVILSFIILLVYDKVNFNRFGEVFYLFILYLLPILIIPIFGIIIFDYSLNIYLGDVRWIQVASILLLLFIVYKNSSKKEFEYHLIWFLRALILVQIPFLIYQINFAVFGGSPGFLLEIWYPGGASRYGTYGVLMGRFSGSFSVPAPLALVSGAIFMISSFRFFMKPNKWDLFFAFLSFFFVMATGGRTLMFGVPLIIIFLFVVYTIHKLKISRKLIRNLFLILVLTILGGYLLVQYDIGRIATGDRVQSTISLIMDIQSFQDVTGRGGDRWERPIIEAYENYSIFGTLGNSSHVLSHLPAFDNYFILIIAQAGPFILLPYLLLMSYLMFYGFKFTMAGESLGVIILSISVVILIYSITANLLTGIAARYLLAIAVLTTHQLK